jgi:hypothetical protein
MRVSGATASSTSSGISPASTTTTRMPPEPEGRGLTWSPAPEGTGAKVRAYPYITLAACGSAPRAVRAHATGRSLNKTVRWATVTPRIRRWNASLTRGSAPIREPVTGVTIFRAVSRRGGDGLFDRKIDA